MPGVAGGDYTKVPSSFRRQDPVRRDGDGKFPTMEKTDGSSSSAARHAPMQDDDDDYAAAAAAPTHDDDDDGNRSSSDPDPDAVREDTMEPDRATEQQQREYEAEQAAMEEEEENGPPPAAMEEEVDGEAGGAAAPLEKDISEPGSEGTGLNARPGVAAAAAALSVEETASVPAMPYDWDMLQMFLTFKMIDTLHNDCGDYVAHMAECFPDVYEHEDRRTRCAICRRSARAPGSSTRPKLQLPLPLTPGAARGRASATSNPRSTPSARRTSSPRRPPSPWDAASATRIRRSSTTRPSRAASTARQC